MKNHLTLVVAGCVSLLFSACSTKVSTDKNAPTTPPSAALTFKGVQAAYYGAVSGGKGTLNFLGEEYPFSYNGLGAGGTGAHQLSATGEVYNLNSLADFPGTYKGTRAGLTLIQGKLHAKMTNENGVVIYVTGKTSGVASSTGVSSVIVTLD